jgi:hypothetical protein
MGQRPAGEFRRAAAFHFPARYFVRITTTASEEPGAVVATPAKAEAATPIRT